MNNVDTKIAFHSSMETTFPAFGISTFGLLSPVGVFVDVLSTFLSTSLFLFGLGSRMSALNLSINSGFVEASLSLTPSVGITACGLNVAV